MTIYGAIPRGAYRQQPRRQPRGLGFERYALWFDSAIPNYGEIPAAAAQLDFTSGDLSIIVCLKRDVINIDQWIIDRGRFAQDGWEFYIAATNALTFRTNQAGPSQSTYSSRALTSTKDWYILGVSRSGASAETYINNAEDIAVAGAHIDPLTSARVARIGIDHPKWWPFNGKIAFLMVYEIALTADEMRWNGLNYHNPVRRDKLALWLPMEEGAGLTIVDHSGYGSDASLLPALTPPTWEQVKQWELRAETE